MIYIFTFLIGFSLGCSIFGTMYRKMKERHIKVLSDTKSIVDDCEEYKSKIESAFAMLEDMAPETRILSHPVKQTTILKN